MEEHEGHTKYIEDTLEGASLICRDCDEYLIPVDLCGQLTKKGKPCRSIVRTDLGHTVCWSHGEGAGRTNRPLHPKEEPEEEEAS